MTDMQTALRANKKVLRKSIETKLRELSAADVQEQCKYLRLHQLVEADKLDSCLSTSHNSPDLIFAFLRAM
jgi:hypothetical protein